MHKVFGRSKTKDMSHKVLQKSLTHAEKLRSVRLNENPSMDDFEKVRTLGTAKLPHHHSSTLIVVSPLHQPLCNHSNHLGWPAWCFHRITIKCSSPFLSIRDLPLIHCGLAFPAGTGTFGRVYLVRHKETGKFYALKVLRKMDVVRLKQVDHIKNEKNILLELNHPFIVTLYVISLPPPPPFATRLIFPLLPCPALCSSSSFLCVVRHGRAATRRGKMRRICTC
jgi:hypothetical protein